MICPQYASKELHRFIVGTCSLHDRNELSVLQYSEDSNYFDVSCVFTHPDQVWAIEASPKDTSLVITSRQSKECLKSLTLWRMPRQTMEDMVSDETEVVQSSQLSEYRTDDAVLDLEELVTFNQNQGAHCVKDVKWHSAGHALLTIDNRLLSAWKIIEGKIVVSTLFYIQYILVDCMHTVAEVPCCINCSHTSASLIVIPVCLCFYSKIVSLSYTAKVITAATIRAPSSRRAAYRGTLIPACSA